MIETFEEGKTLFIDGPARLQLLSGRASVLGAPLNVGDSVVVRRGRRMPFEVLPNSKVELTLGDSASFAETEGGAVPSSWKYVCNKILAQEGRKVILVIGGVDSGKTSFCTYLANLSLKAECRVALIDGDVGQSDIGPPGTVGLTFVEEPVIDLFRLQAEDLVFIGVTSPSKKMNSTINALAAMQCEILKRGANLILVNTDGWVEGGDAVNYKVQLVKRIAPDFIVAIQKENELAPLLDALRCMEVLVVDSPKNTKNRDRGTRKLLRELAYKKFLKDAKVRSFPLNWVEIDGDLGLRTDSKPQLKGREEGMFGKDGTPREETILENEQMRNPVSGFDKTLTHFHGGDERGLLVGLEGAYGKFLGIGTICDFDSTRRVIKIYTPVDETVSKIWVGRIRLDSRGNEVGLV